TKCIATSTSDQTYIFDRYPQDEAAYAAGRGKVSGSTDWDWGGLVIGNYAELDANNNPSNWEAASVTWLSSISAADPGGTQFATPILNASGSVFMSKEMQNDISNRYIVVKLTNVPIAPKIAHFMFMREHKLAIRPQYPLQDTYNHDTKEQNLSGGDRVVSLQAQNFTKGLSRSLTILGGATRDSIIDWYKEGSGTTRFVVYLENINEVSTANICRLDKSQFTVSEKLNQLFVSGLNMTTVLQYESGEDW
ncbi:hypothetical protein LCGC14_2082740, partial [marine sediment metagenome]